MLLLQIATRNPNPAYTARMSTLTALIPEVKSQSESRKSVIDKVPLSHGLLPVILKDTSEERPAAPPLCYSIRELKNTALYSRISGFPVLEVSELSYRPQ